VAIPRSLEYGDVMATQKTTIRLTGGGKLDDHLDKLERRLMHNRALNVGFLENATYPKLNAATLRKMYAARKKRTGQKGYYADVKAIKGAAKNAGATGVAEVAAYNEFGTATSPPRPFFRTMIKRHSATWGPDLAKVLKAVDYDVDRALALMGEKIAGDLRQSIIDTNAPPLKKETVKRKGFSKPLIDTSHLLHSVDYEVR